MLKVFLILSFKFLKGADKSQSGSDGSCLERGENIGAIPEVAGNDSQVNIEHEAATMTRSITPVPRTRSITPVPRTRSSTPESIPRTRSSTLVSTSNDGQMNPDSQVNFDNQANPDSQVNSGNQVNLDGQANPMRKKLSEEDLKSGWIMINKQYLSGSESSRNSSGSSTTSEFTRCSRLSSDESTRLSEEETPESNNGEPLEGTSNENLLETSGNGSSENLLETGNNGSNENLLERNLILFNEDVIGEAVTMNEDTIIPENTITMNEDTITEGTTEAVQQNQLAMGNNNTEILAENSNTEIPAEGNNATNEGNNITGDVPFIEPENAQNVPEPENAQNVITTEPVIAAEPETPDPDRVLFKRGEPRSIPKKTITDPGYTIHDLYEKAGISSGYILDSVRSGISIPNEKAYEILLELNCLEQLEDESDYRNIILRALLTECIKKNDDAEIERFRIEHEKEMVRQLEELQKQFDELEAADKKLAEERAAAERKHAEEKAALEKQIAEKKAAEEKAAAEKRQAEEKADAEKKAAEEKAAKERIAKEKATEERAATFYISNDEQNNESIGPSHSREGTSNEPAPKAVPSIATTQKPVPATERVFIKTEQLPSPSNAPAQAKQATSRSPASVSNLPAKGKLVLPNDHGLPPKESPILPPPIVPAANSQPTSKVVHPPVGTSLHPYHHPRDSSSRAGLPPPPPPLSQRDSSCVGIPPPPPPSSQRTSSCVGIPPPLPPPPQRTSSCAGIPPASVTCQSIPRVTPNLLGGGVPPGGVEREGASLSRRKSIDWGLNTHYVNRSFNGTPIEQFAKGFSPANQPASNPPTGNAIPTPTVLAFNQWVYTPRFDNQLVDTPRSSSPPTPVSLKHPSSWNIYNTFRWPETPNTLPSFANFEQTGSGEDEGTPVPPEIYEKLKKKIMMYKKMDVREDLSNPYEFWQMFKVMEALRLYRDDTMMVLDQMIWNGILNEKCADAILDYYMLNCAVIINENGGGWRRMDVSAGTGPKYSLSRPIKQVDYDNEGTWQRYIKTMIWMLIDKFGFEYRFNKNLQLIFTADSINCKTATDAFLYEYDFKKGNSGSEYSQFLSGTWRPFFTDVVEESGSFIPEGGKCAHKCVHDAKYCEPSASGEGEKRLRNRRYLYGLIGLLSSGGHVISAKPVGDRMRFQEKFRLANRRGNVKVINCIMDRVGFIDDLGFIRADLTKIECLDVRFTGNLEKDKSLVNLLEMVKPVNVKLSIEGDSFVMFDRILRAVKGRTIIELTLGKDDKISELVFMMYVRKRHEQHIPENLKLFGSGQLTSSNCNPCLGDHFSGQTYEEHISRRTGGVVKGSVLKKLREHTVMSIVLNQTTGVFRKFILNDLGSIPGLAYLQINCEERDEEVAKAIALIRLKSLNLNANIKTIKGQGYAKDLKEMAKGKPKEATPQSGSADSDSEGGVTLSVVKETRSSYNRLIEEAELNPNFNTMFPRPSIKDTRERSRFIDEILLYGKVSTLILKFDDYDHFIDEFVDELWGETGQPLSPNSKIRKSTLDRLLVIDKVGDRVIIRDASSKHYDSDSGDYPMNPPKMQSMPKLCKAPVTNSRKKPVPSPNNAKRYDNIPVAKPRVVSSQNLNAAGHGDNHGIRPFRPSIITLNDVDMEDDDGLYFRDGWFSNHSSDDDSYFPSYFGTGVSQGTCKTRRRPLGSALAISSDASRFKIFGCNSAGSRPRSSHGRNKRNAKEAPPSSSSSN